MNGSIAARSSSSRPVDARDRGDVAHGDHQQVDRRLRRDVLGRPGSRRRGRPRRPGSRPPTMRQNRQSVTRRRPSQVLAGDARHHHGHHPARGAGSGREHEPRVVRAEAREGAVLVALLHQHHVAAAHPRPRGRAKPSAVGQVAQAPRALAELLGAPARPGMPAAGVPGRGEYGKTCTLPIARLLHHPGGAAKGGLVLAREAHDRVRGQVDAGQRGARPPAGVHVARPGRRSGPSQRRMPASPDCSGTCRCGATTGVSETAASRRRPRSPGSIEEMRRRAQPLDRARRRAPGRPGRRPNPGRDRCRC